MKWSKINIHDLQMNVGQIEGVPSNPRLWSFDDVERLKKSIIDTPELINIRGLIVYPQDDKFIVLGGNMRYVALQSLGRTDIDCIVLPSTTSVETLRKIVIKDNGQFGKWDFNELDSGKWAEFDFVELGIKPLEELPSLEKKSKNADYDNKIEIKIVCSVGEFERIMQGLRKIDEDKNIALLKLIEYNEQT